MNNRIVTEFFSASCVPDGGAYRYRLFADGHTELLQKIPMDRPKFLAEKDGLLYATLIEPFEASKDSGVLTVDLAGNRVGEIQSSKGCGICHIALCDDDVYIANYNSGSLIRMPDKLVVHSGAGVNPRRQEKPHVHSVFLSPCEKYVLSCDLGTDDVYVYTRDLEYVSSAKTPLGAGPRHLCFSKCGEFVYCLNEMGGSISVFAWDDGMLELRDTVSILPPDFEGGGAGSAIKLSADGKMLYASERASHTIATLKVEGEKLTVVANTPCGGLHPRDFTLLGEDRFAIASNLFSDNMALFRIGADRIPVFMSSIPLPQPLCVIETALSE